MVSVSSSGAITSLSPRVALDGAAETAAGSTLHSLAFGGLPSLDLAAQPAATQGASYAADFSSVDAAAADRIDHGYLAAFLGTSSGHKLTPAHAAAGDLAGDDLGNAEFWVTLTSRLD